MIAASERIARLLVLGAIIGLVLLIFTVRQVSLRDVIELHAMIPEEGGWSLENLSAKAGKPLRLRLISDDVLHGFAIGQIDDPEIILEPGRPVETSVRIDTPGKYVFYCTRWCGPNHWRMRGVIEVIGKEMQEHAESIPPYVALDLDIDADHPASIVPDKKPSAVRGKERIESLPEAYLSQEYYQVHSPTEAWFDLRSVSSLSTLSDQDIWDLVAGLWSRQVSAAGIEQGANLYASNCAACHGPQGNGDGVFAAFPRSDSTSKPVEINHALAQEKGHDTGGISTRPRAFTDPKIMLGANPAILHGKILRGGMGTGMPYWGPIFTDKEIWNLVGYLWSFQFELEVGQ